jgi:hypothetical protein
MVAKDGDLPISFVIRVQLFLEGRIFQGIFVQQSLERYGRIEGTEYLRGETLHLGLEMLVQPGRLSTRSDTIHEEEPGPYVHAIEQIVVVVFIFLEYADILENLKFHGNPIVVTNRILAQKVEDDEVGCFESDMLALQGAAADRLCFILALLIASTKGKFIDEVHGRRTLTISHDFGLEISVVVLSDTVNVFLGHS